MTMLLKDVMFLDGSMDSARSGDILIENGKISSVGKAGSLIGDDIVDGKGRMAVLPGFVNCHTHAAMSLLRGLGEERPLKEWLEEQIWPVEANLNPERIYWGTRSALMEMASSGTTCFGDMYFEMDKVAEAAKTCGMRTGICRGIVGDDESKIEESLALADRYKDDPMVTVQMGPHAPYTVPFDAMKKIASSAKDKGMSVHLHYLETEWELGYLKDDFGTGAMEYLEKTGLCDVSGLILAHCVWFPEDELSDLSRVPATVVHNPGSNLKLGSGVAPVRSMLSSGVSVALGTDGAASNNRLDMWGELRTAALLHKGVLRDPSIVTAREILDGATYRGYRALGFEKAGLIREGWKADLVLVDLDGPNYIGVNEENLGVFLVYAGSSSDVAGTMVDGSWIYINGEFPGQDEEEVLSHARKARAELIRR